MRTLRANSRLRPLPLLTLGLAFVSSVSTAAPPGTSSPSDEAAKESRDLQQAREAFLEGRKWMAQEKWSAAVEAFRQALRVRETAGLHYYAGLCSEHAGDLLAAHSEFLAAYRLLAAQPAPDVQPLLAPALTRTEARLSQLKVLDAPPGAEVFVDKERSQSPGQVWLKPGEHLLQVTAAGYAPREWLVATAAGGATTVRAELTLLVAASPRAVPPPASSRVSTETERYDVGPGPALLFWGSTVVVLGGVGAGVAGLVLHDDASDRGQSASTELDAVTGGSLSACTNPDAELREPCQRLRTAKSDAENATLLMASGFVAAGIGVMGVLGSRLLWPRSKVLFSTSLGPRMAMLRLSGRF